MDNIEPGVEEIWEAFEKIYKEEGWDRGKYCHQTSFRWGFERWVIERIKHREKQESDRSEQEK